MKNYYEILEVDQKASFKEIRSAFRRLCKRYHPDINPGNQLAEAHFNDLQEAYNILKDGIKREEFDEHLKSIGYRPNAFTIFKNATRNKFSRQQKDDDLFDREEEELDFRPPMEKPSRLYLKIAAIVVFPLLALGGIAYLENRMDNSPFDERLTYEPEPESIPAKETLDKIKDNDKRFIDKLSGFKRIISPKSLKKENRKKTVSIKRTTKTKENPLPEPEKPSTRSENEHQPAPASEPVKPVSVPKEEENATARDLNKVYTGAETEKRPQFPGGSPAFIKYLKENLVYPAAAKEDGISGRVLVNFIIEKDGRITNVSVAQGIGGGCDEEALRVMKNAPAWIPGEAQGGKVRVKATIPISFKLN